MHSNIKKCLVKINDIIKRKRRELLTTINVHISAKNKILTNLRCGLVASQCGMFSHLPV